MSQLTYALHYLLGTEQEVKEAKIARDEAYKSFKKLDKAHSDIDKRYKAMMVQSAKDMSKINAEVSVPKLSMYW